MALFNKTFMKESQKAQEIQAKLLQEQEKEQEKEQDQEKTQEKYLGETYIWVEGYKGTDEDMCCQANIFSNRECYELNEEKTCKGHPDICMNGYHFCLNLQDVFKHYSFNFKNRFFKVKAYVKKSDYDNYKEYKKLAAKKIILTEEVDIQYEDISIYDITYFNGGYKYVLTEEEFTLAKKDMKVFHEYCRNKFVTRMKETGYTETFANLLFHRYLKADNDIKLEIALMYYDLERAKAYCEEELSKDMAVYLLTLGK